MNPKIPVYHRLWCREASVRLTGRDRRRLAAARLRAGLAGRVQALAGSQGFERARKKGEDKGWHNFDIHAGVFVDVDSDDVQAAIDRLKPREALYVGGMGAQGKNFHNDLMCRRGFADAAARIQELYLAGHKKEAEEAVPDEYIDLKSLMGPPARIKERYKAWDECGATSLTVRSAQEEAIHVMAEAARLNQPR